MKFDPVDALDRCFDNFRLRNRDLNAIVHLDEVGARSAALSSSARIAKGQALSPIDGLPLVVKANVAVRDMPWTAALMPFRDRVAVADSEVVGLLRSAGAVIIGISNMHEAALGGTTDSPLYGPCLHPLDARLTPGGSSGGSAVAVAAGMAIAAIGTDTMGSVRMPSAYCGISGFKPSFALVPREGVELLSPTLDHVGFHAGDVDTLISILSVIPPFNPISKHAAIGGLRAGFFPAASVVLDAAVLTAYETARSRLAPQFGMSADVNWDCDVARLRRHCLLICEQEFAAAHPRDLSTFLLQTSPAFRSMINWGVSQTTEKWKMAQLTLKSAREFADRLFDTFDVVMSPTAPQTAFPHSYVAPENQADLTVLANAAGLPAITVPIPVPLGSSPIGLQIMASPGKDALTLAVAKEVSRVLN